MEGGLPLQKIEEKVLKPLENRIDRLARFVCDRLVSAIAVDFLTENDEEDKSKSMK